MKKKQFSEAEKYYKTAISINKNFALAHYNLALLYDIYFQDIKRAYAQYLKYLSLVPDDKETQAWADELKYSLGN